jgi:hypothetical protein
LRADELALRVGKAHGAGKIDDGLQSRRIAGGECERGAAAHRSAERDHARAIGIGAFGDRTQRPLKIVRLDGKVLAQRRLVALCIRRVGCLAGRAARQAVAAPDHGHREVAAVREVAALWRHQRTADLRHLRRETRLAVREERNRQPSLCRGTAHDQRFQPIASAVFL